MWVHLCLWSSLLAVLSAEVITLVNDTIITCVLTGNSKYKNFDITNSNTLISLKRSYIYVSDKQCVNSKGRKHQCTDQMQKRNSSYIVYEHTENETRFSICVESLVRVKISDSNETPQLINLTNESCDNSSDYCCWKYLKIKEMSTNLQEAPTVFATTTDKGNDEITQNPNTKKYPKTTESVKKEKKSEANTSNKWTVIIQNSNRNNEKNINFAYKPKSVAFEISVKKSGKIIFHKYHLDKNMNVNPGSLSESYININSSYECITILISANVGCHLDITLNSDKKKLVNETISFTNNKLKQIKVKTNHANVKRLYFHPSRICNWTIHNIQKCPQKYDIYSTTVHTSDASEHVCKIRNSSTDQNYSLKNCNSTHIGKKCAIKCSNILGDSFQNCEKHKIYLEGRYFCAWGFKGPKCDQRSKNGYWGLDCDKRYGRNCEECEPTYDGCKKCKEKFIGSNCSDILPVVLHPPELVAIENDSVTLQINLKHNHNELRPEYFILQYKKIPSDDYQNYSKEEDFPTKLNNTICLNTSIIDPRNTSYVFRVLLISQKRYVTDVPTLTIPKRTFSAAFHTSGNLTLKWTITNFSHYIVEYKCSYKFCSNEEMKKNSTELITGEFQIPEKQHFSSCLFKLFASRNTSFSLIDIISLKTNESKTTIDDLELPRTISLSQNAIFMDLENCTQFDGPLTYVVELRCISNWCKDEHKAVETHLKEYTQTPQINVTLNYFTTYNVTVSAKRSSLEERKEFPNLITPPDKPATVEDFSAYGRDNNTLFVKWKNPYPPRGKIEKYEIIQDNLNETICQKDTSPCKPWHNYTCANITVLEDQDTFNFIIQAKNFNVSEWSEKRNFTINANENSSAPENLKIRFSSNSSIIILSWEHPAYIYGKLEQFLITISDHDTQTFISVNEYQRNYTTQIPIKHCNNYTLAVFVHNKFQRDIASIFVSISNPVTNISQLPFIVWCTDFCHLLQPQNVSGIVVKAKGSKLTTTNQPARSLMLSDADLKKFNHSSLRTLELEAFFEGQSYNIDFTNNESTNATLTTSIIIIASCCGTITVLLFVVACYVLKRKRKIKASFKESNSNTLKLSHLNTNDPSIKQNTEFWQNRNINIDKFENYLLTTLEEDPDDNGISKQFQLVPMRANKDCNIGDLPQNNKKNRYKDIIPYNDTRVILQDPEGDYINANYVNGYNKSKAFIATQAPLESTVDDFWTMICQNSVQTIIMLTELTENNRIKSMLYWPEHQSYIRFGTTLIQNVSSRITPNYVYRKFQVINDDTTHEIQHYQYTSWPDHGVPLCLTDFTNFIKEIMSIPQKSPIVVHCNAGCGRTGTFIMCDIAIKMATQTKKVSFLKILKDLRQQRSSLVYDVHQYIFAHRVVLEYFFGENFSIPVDKNFESKVRRVLGKKSLDRLVKHLDKITKQHERTHFKSQRHLTDEEKAKNRFSTILPSNAQIFLPVTSSSESNYINAVTVDCYRYPKKFIVTQQPLPNTINDFWKLILEYDIYTIVSLNKIVNDSKCPRFWPQHSEEWSINFSNTLSLYNTKTDNETYEIIRVKILSRKPEPNKKFITIINMKNWKRQTCRPIEVKNLIHVWKKIMTSGGQIVVTCYDGSTASGLFVALAYLLEKMNMDHICDVYSAVKSVRESRSQFVEHLEQLRFLYEAAVEYIKGFSTYGNFS